MKETTVVKDIQSAIETYRRLDATGKRLFRAETGLESVKRAGRGKQRATRAAASKPRAARKPKTAAPAPAPVTVPGELVEA
jgi:hypothetical protein